MKNAVVYSFYIRNGSLETNRLWRQVLYSITTLRKFNVEIDVDLYISPSTVITESVLATCKTLKINVIPFINRYRIEDKTDIFYESWHSNGYAEFLWHRWENAYKSLEGRENILYLDTDTVFHEDPEKLFDIYGGTEYVWAREDNSEDLMSALGNSPAMNDGQFLLNKRALIYKDESLDHAIKYINSTLDRMKTKISADQHHSLHWVLIQYAMHDFYKSKRLIRYFDKKHVMLHIEPITEDTGSLVLHHYYNGNTDKFVSKDFSIFLVNDKLQHDFDHLTKALTYPPTDKGTNHNYLPVYSAELNKTANVSLLEIGVYKGGSILLWRSYLQNSRVVGIDSVNWSKVDRVEDNLLQGEIYYGTYQNLVSMFENDVFDYIINDSMHEASAQLEAFHLYYPKLKNGGKFFMEDVQGDKELDIIKVSLKDFKVRVWDMRSSSFNAEDSIIVIVEK